MNSKNVEKAYNTCNEKVVSHHNEHVNSENHGFYHHEMCESQHTNKTV